MRMKERNQAVLLMLLSALSFSLMQVAVKISAMSVGTLQQVFCRNLISLFIALILLRKKHLPLNSYVSLYEVEEDEDERKEIPLIDKIRSDVDNNPEVLYVGKEYVEIFIENLKDSLSALENHVLYLHLMGTDYRTIAEILNKSPKTVDNALQRIKAKAGKLLRSR